MAHRMVLLPMPMTSSELEVHFCCFKPL